MSVPAALSSCSITATLDVIGDRWTLLILREIFRGQHRFSEIQSQLGVARNLLSERLGQLVEADVLERVPYQERPVRREYRLTPKGADLSASLIALMKWGDRWYSDDEPPTVLVHRRCGTPVDLHVSCPKCGTAVPPGQVQNRTDALKAEAHSCPE
ncbi:MAG: helix-turn-helix transcriptional regulator [Acidimicrobiia bacterium]|nr:helix-turn-helix transcriptional regulator [Acidimicrobiia bacterium]